MLLALGVSGVAFADGPVTGRVVVPGDHFQPGESITIRGSEISGGQVRLRLTRGETSVDMGAADVGLDGTFEATATVPSTFPLGYAELTATDDNGNTATTLILIGDRAEGPTTPAGAAIDERVLGLALAGLGLVVAVVAGAWYLRGRTKGTASAR